MVQESGGTRVNYYVANEPNEAASNFFMPGNIITLSALRAAFPFYGRFHFRYQTTSDGMTVWEDIISPDDPIPNPGGVISLKVLLMDVGDDDLSPAETQAVQCQYSAMVARQEEKHRQERAQKEAEKEGSVVKKASGLISKLWKSGTAAASSYLDGGRREPDEQAGANLATLELNFSSPFVTGFEEHEVMLQNLWSKVHRGPCSGHITRPLIVQLLPTQTGAPLWPRQGRWQSPLITHASAKR
jgi:hypothetical protein